MLQDMEKKAMRVESCHLAHHVLELKQLGAYAVSLTWLCLKMSSAREGCIHTYILQHHQHP